MAENAASPESRPGFWSNFFKKTMSAEQQALVGMLAFFAIIVAVGWVAVTEQDRMTRFDQQYSARSIARGAALFAANCKPCHGANGEGTPGVAPALHVPTQFDGTRLKELGFSGTNRDYFTLTISAGRPAKSDSQWPNPMPTWSQQYGGPLRQDQVRDLVNFVMNWGCEYDPKCIRPDDKETYAHLPTVPAPATAEPIEAVCPGGADAGKCIELADLPQGDAANGEALYTQSVPGPNGQPMACKACHSVDGTVGVGPSWQGLKDRVPEGYDSVEAYVYTSILHPSEYLREGFADAMPKNFGEILDAQALADLIAFVSSQ